jgi:hypothetical protein
MGSVKTIEEMVAVGLEAIYVLSQINIQEVIR